MSGLRDIAHGRIALASEHFGNPADPALVLVMGASASMLFWPDDFCAALAAGARFVIRYDNRDTGRSTVSAGPIDYTMADMADDLIAIMDGYGLERAHIAGMSLGGMIAQMSALKHPDRIASLTLISSSAYDESDESLPPLDPDVLSHFMSRESLDWQDRDAVIAFNAETLRLCANDPDRFDPDEARSLATREFDRAIDPQASASHAGLSGDPDWDGRLKDIAAPALVIHGRRDRVLALAYGERLASGLNARMVVLDGGHELNAADRPAIVAAILDHTAAAQASRGRAK